MPDKQKAISGRVKLICEKPFEVNGEDFTV